MKLGKETKLSQTPHGRWYEDACAAAFAMELVGERWSLLIVRELMLGPRRFSDIRAELPGLSAKVLTERLARLEELGVLIRRKLPPPAGVQVFELTDWGRELEFVMQALGRWAVRSPLHDASLPMTATSFLLSLRTMIDPEKARGLHLRVLFRTPQETMSAEVANGELVVARHADPGFVPDFVFAAQAVDPILAVIYGKQEPGDCGVTISGDVALSERFVDLFALPEKCPLPGGG